MTYSIVRHFQDNTREDRVLMEHFSLEDAKEYCNDETSHSSYYLDGANPEGPGVVWFDMLVKEDDENE